MSGVMEFDLQWFWHFTWTMNMYVS